MERISSFIFLLFGLHYTVVGQDTVKVYSESPRGRGASICNIVYGGNVQAVSEDAPIALYIDDSLTRQKIKLVFPKRIRKKFPYDPEKKLPDHRACVSGKIRHSGGTAVIVIRSEKQIRTFD